MGTFTASESISTTETDMLRNKSYRQSGVDRAIEDLGLFIATLANLTSCRIKVGQEIVAEIDRADGTDPDPSKLRDVFIPVDANEVIQVLVTNTVATRTDVVLNLEDLE